jgi:hypothetical protein
VHQHGEQLPLGAAYDDLLAERELFTVLMHGFAAGADPAIGPVVRACFGRLYDTIRELTDAGPEQARDFFAHGMLLTVLGAMHVIGPDAVPQERWMTELVSSLELPKPGLTPEAGKTPDPECTTGA